MAPELLSKLNALKEASYDLQSSSEEQRNQFLGELARQLREAEEDILNANQKDLEKMELSDPLYDRLQLTPERLAGICKEVETIRSLPDPLHRILETSEGPSGIQLTKTSVPIGIIGVIYEARPNVTIDVTTLCIKSGNAVLLRGSQHAYESNQVLVSIIQKALQTSGFSQHCVELLSPDRALSDEMLQADEYLDLIIPRGGKKLIDHVRKHSSVPTIETGASVVHTFVDESANFEMACRIINNEKTRRPSVCNALDTVLVHESILESFLPELAEGMAQSHCILHADDACHNILKHHYEQERLMDDAKDHLDHEFLSLEMNVIAVKDLDEAIQYIRKYSLKHSESIVTNSKENAKKFQDSIDAACVYVNTSTAFSDGAQFGLGAEIGISTQKLHARGPMGLQELTSYKWLIESDGLIRE